MVVMGNCPEQQPINILEVGTTRDIIAKKVGFGSEREDLA